MRPECRSEAAACQGVECGPCGSLVAMITAGDVAFYREQVTSSCPASSTLRRSRAAGRARGHPRRCAHGDHPHRGIRSRARASSRRSPRPPGEDAAQILRRASTALSRSWARRRPPGVAGAGGAAARLQDQPQVAKLRLARGVAPGLGLLPAHQRRPPRRGRDARRLHSDNGPLLVVPRSHRGPILDHHAQGHFCGAVDPRRWRTSSPARCRSPVAPARCPFTTCDASRLRPERVRPAARAPPLRVRGRGCVAAGGGPRTSRSSMLDSSPAPPPSSRVSRRARSSAASARAPPGLDLREPDGGPALLLRHGGVGVGAAHVSVRLGAVQVRNPDPCEAFTHHGYLGIEQDVVAKIAAWIAR